jgi:septum formation protein
VITLILASASPARARLLVQAGVHARQIVSGVDEDAITTSLGAATAPTDVVAALARAKAEAVAAMVTPTEHEQLFVIGCDSVLDIDGRALGKPTDAHDAVERWRAMRGRSGVLRTGHCVINVRSGQVHEAVDATLVRFADPSDQEIAAYVATGEPLAVAGAFTLDGLGSAFVAGIDGDPSNVIGLSVPLLRTLLQDHGITWTDLWGRTSS